MKIFEDDKKWGRKINFVDDSNVFVGYDYSQCCCEDFGYYFSLDEDGKERVERTEEDLEGYQFDKTFHKILDNDREYGECMTTVFRLVKGDDVIYLAIYNDHNGYYCHDFEFCEGEVVIFNGSL